jgi:hypothetical protein
MPEGWEGDMIQVLVVLAVVLMVVVPVRADNGLMVREIGSFHVGGQAFSLRSQPSRPLIAAAGRPAPMVDPNGDFEVGQMYVQYVALTSPRARYPLLLWHGGGLTGVSFETTPDGRAGWQWFFLRAGHDVYLSDSVERGRASWARYPEIYPAEPIFRTKKSLWELFRIGPTDSYAPELEKRVAYPDTRFPTRAFDQFVKQVVPRFTTNDAATQAAYDTLVRRVCPCVILTHSAAGPFGFAAALAAPELVKAHIAVEPSGGPNPGTVDIARLRSVPHLFVWGDHLNLDQKSGLWAGLYGSTVRFRDALAAAGGATEWIDLPARGIAGNSHMLMMDDNSDRVAALIQDWMARSRLMR